MILKVILILIMVVGFGGVILGILGMVYDHIQNKSINHIKIEELNIPKTKYTQMVIDWCGENISTPNHQPTYQIKYHTNKKWDGNYDPKTKNITIYLGNIKTLLQLTEIIIHEYNHHLQNKKGFSQKYDEYTTTKGYWNNPYEVDCRKVSNQYKYRCLNDLINNNILKK
jgi:hypothetical protein